MKDFFHQLSELFSRQDFFRFSILAFLLVSVGILELISLSAIPLYIGTITGQMTGSANFQKLPAFLRNICGNTYWFSLLFIILYLLRAGYLKAVTRLQYHIISNRTIALTSRIYRELLGAPYSFILSQPQALITQVLTQNTYHITFTILAGLLTLIRCLFLAVLTAVLILGFHFRLSITAIVFLCITCGFHMFRRSCFLKRSGIEVNTSQQQALLAVHETLQAVPETKIYGLQEYFNDRMHRIVEKRSTCEGRIQTSNHILWPTLEVLTLLSLISAMLITMHLEHRTPLELAPALTLLTIALTRLKVFFSESMLAFNNILCHQEDLQQTCGLMRKLKLNHREPPPEKTLDFQELKFEQAGFSYSRDAPPALKDVSFTLHRGQAMGITGPTGCGKSTLLNIILGLLPPTQGQVTINGRDMTLQTTGWQRKIGYVPQTIALFDDTVLRNITLGLPEEQIDCERFRRAVEGARLTEYLDRQPLREQTLIRGQGKNLSGGERQRIGIARALYRNPEILILDEATSALDSETEDAVAGAIGNLKGTVTMIIVAHRPATLRLCDFLLPLTPARKQ